MKNLSVLSYLIMWSLRVFCLFGVATVYTMDPSVVSVGVQCNLLQQQLGTSDEYISAQKQTELSVYEKYFFPQEIKDFFTLYDQGDRDAFPKKPFC